jgi:hypothetical protein
MVRNITQEITRIEFPLPPIVSRIVELIPVAMMVGNCSEARRCAYCHEEFEAGSARRFCSCCASATHEECSVLNESCNELRATIYYSRVIFYIRHPAGFVLSGSSGNHSNLSNSDSPTSDGCNT